MLTLRFITRPEYVRFAANRTLIGNPLGILHPLQSLMLVLWATAIRQELLVAPLRMGSMICRGCVIALFLAGGAVALPASGRRLLSPWDATKIVPTDAPYNCPEPPAFSKTLTLDGYYTDKNYSIIDEQKLVLFQKESEGPTHLGQNAGLAADAWLSKGGRSAATCVYSLLTAAAKADAWADKMPQNNGVYFQNWVLSGAAVAYLKVRDSGAGTAEQDEQIEKWFRALSTRVREYFDAGRKRPGSDAWNNHMYWAGLAVAAGGVADNDAEAFFWGLSTYAMGIHSIRPDGSLDAEMGRKRMALHYQLYALGALVMIAELGEANGVDLYSERDGAIHRLVQFDLAAMKDPSVIAKRTGETQVFTPPFSGLEIGWAVPYVQRFPSADLSALIAQATTVRFWQWGGAPPDAVKPAGGYSVELKNNIEAELAGMFPAGLAESSFLGDWCGQGREDLRATIADGGDALVLNNGQGSTSTGDLHGPFLLDAPAWGGVGGALSPDRSQIDWTNGTYWTRCPSAPLRPPVNLNGRWVAQAGGCSIEQQQDRLSIGETSDCLAAGRVDEQGHLMVEFHGVKLEGTVTADGKHINWQDGSYWTRAQVYGLVDGREK